MLKVKNCSFEVWINVDNIKAKNHNLGVWVNAGNVKQIVVFRLMCKSKNLIMFESCNTYLLFFLANMPNQAV